jgi:hypothetical protein
LGFEVLGQWMHPRLTNAKTFCGGLDQDLSQAPASGDR